MGCRGGYLVGLGAAGDVDLPGDEDDAGVAGLHKAQPLGGILQRRGHVAQAQPLEGGHERCVVRDHAEDRTRQVRAAQQLLDLPATLTLHFQPGNTRHRCFASTRLHACFWAMPGTPHVGMLGWRGAGGYNRGTVNYVSLPFAQKGNSRSFTWISEVWTRGVEVFSVSRVASSRAGMASAWHRAADICGCTKRMRCGSTLQGRACLVSPGCSAQSPRSGHMYRFEEDCASQDACSSQRRRRRRAVEPGQADGGGRRRTRTVGAGSWGW